MVIEVLSPKGAGRERREKFFEYIRGGVPDQWLIDPGGCGVEFYFLEEGHYRLAFEGSQGKYTASEPKGSRARIEWFEGDPLPKVSDVLRELAVV